MIGIWCLTMCMWTKLLRFKLLQTPDVCFFFFFVWGRVKKCDSCVVDDRVGKQMVSFSLILTCVNRVCTDLSFKGLSLWSVNRRINSELTFTAFNGCLFFFFFCFKWQLLKLSSLAFQNRLFKCLFFLALNRRKLLINIFRCCHYWWLAGLL